jgi:chemotaxis protein methyltransferase CheR
MVELVAALRTPELGERAFERVSAKLYDVAGIRLTAEKRELVRARLWKRMGQLGIKDFDTYVDTALGDPRGEELARMIDVLTTNKTNFFREEAHFEFLRSVVLPEVAARGARIRIWSAACSTGEEPYTIAMVLAEALAQLESWDVRILASDISARVLETARGGEYREEHVREVDPVLRSRYFQRTPGGTYRIAANLRNLVHFARLNLMEEWPMRGPFDVVFCRNVMIYFDRETQQRLVSRFRDLIRPGGYLIVGHSESLTSFRSDYEFVRPATYRRPD